MLKLTPEGEKIVESLAARFGVSVDAVRAMLEAVAHGGGTMAQFNIPELGGGGQWMMGGMTMAGDMFNNSLKATIDGLCSELSRLVSANAAFMPPPASSYQSQSQGGGGYGDGVSVFVPQSFHSGSWWPSELGSPASTGAQNSLRYAYFPGSRRLAIDYGGRIEVYDTLDHQISGFSQQQSGDASLTFTSQNGVVRVDSLPRADGTQPASYQAPQYQAPSNQPVAGQSADRPAPPPAPQSGDAHTIVALIEQLGQLKEKGILTAEEFAAKKAELLQRL